MKSGIQEIKSNQTLCSYISSYAFFTREIIRVA